MKVTQRNMTVTMPIIGTVVPVSTVVVNLTTFNKLMVVDPAILTKGAVLSAPNLEIATPSAVVLSDPNFATRFVTIARHVAPHNLLEYTIVYDNKYNDMFIIPSLEPYQGMPYIASTPIRLDGYGVNFTGDPGSKIPAVNPAYIVNGELVNVPKYTGVTGRGRYYEKLITTNNNLGSPSVAPSYFINFGLPSAMFTTIGFPAQINILGYSSLFEWGPVDMGIQTMSDVGNIIVELPL